MRADLTNAEIAELLALEAESSRPPAQRALRRASRRAFLWDEDAVALIRSRRPLTELSGVGPYIARLIRGWITNRPKTSPATTNPLWIPHDYRSARSPWRRRISGSQVSRATSRCTAIGATAAPRLPRWLLAALDRNYEYIAITDHGKGLKIAGGIDEEQLARQGMEIENLNASSRVRVRDSACCARSN